ncbi:DUF4861 family protein [uncultured Alistipes sp.]|jgi:hypothetical protein|uniref:DUF4861 family protein n=1 Tax=uncultured Alistipes sp. TaxID=538949 RepID=UPI0025FB42B1|nr:DUF4861 family protein [uncultured Alistipes sp.]
MKRILTIVLAFCTVLNLNAKTQKHVYRVSVAGSRPNCPVVVSDIPVWARSAVVKAGGKEIASQLDRELGELAFVADVSAQKDFRIVFSSKPSKNEYKSRVHAQMWLKNPDKSLQAVDTVASFKDDMYHKLHHHGPAFESERAAYRIYFDKKQTIDTYGKKQSRLELAETMWYPSDEQLAAGYGHDNLRVFGSVGVGALKGWDAKKQKMVHISDFERREARILTKGPVRTIVEMRVEGWEYEGRRINMTSRYILYAGHSDVQVENSIEGNTRGLLLTTGVMKMAENSVMKSRRGVLATCGRDFPENDTLKWERESVCLAVAVPQRLIVSQIDDKTSYLYQLAPDSRGRIDYVFDTAWRKNAWALDIGEECLTSLVESVGRALAPVVVTRIR